MDQIEKMVYLRTIDTIWVEHLNALEVLREGIGLRGYGQRDPLVEYKAEAYNLFQRLMASISGQVVEILLKAEINPQPLSVERQSHRRMHMQGADEAMAGGAIASPQGVGRRQPEPVKQNNDVQIKVRQKSTEDVQKSTPSAFGHVGRNDVCPCGSGKKFKKCHGK
jgi:preprotein translocase subunit SecA